VNLNGLVEVCPADVPVENAKSKGTGYLVSSRLVLTARHNLEKGDPRKIQPRHWVRPYGKSWSKSPADVAWEDEKCDLALLRFPQTGSSLENLLPIPWGRVPLREKVECRIIGFPSFVDSSPADTRKLNIEAVIDPASGKGPPELALKVKPGQPLPCDPSGWAGYSGTAIFAADFLVGVVIRTPTAAHGLLWGQAVSQLFEDQKFRETLMDGGCSVPTTGALPTVLGEVSSQLAQLVRQYPFPKVSEADCYDLLGVAKSKYVDWHQARGETPPYVARNIDGQLSKALAHKKFVLLVGPSRAGKTRAAYEALLRVAPSIPMVVPFPGEDLGKIVELLRYLPDRLSRGVLWLSDIDKCLSRGTFDLRVAETALRELEMQIVATIRSKEFAALKEKDDIIVRDAQQVLERAEIIKLDDRMTPEEEQRAREAYPGLKLGPSLGESFISGRELKDRYDYGDPPMIAVVRAANDWKRTGLEAPIHRDDLFSFFRRHFEELEPTQDASEEVFRKALEDARNPVAHYSALLYRKRSAKGEEEYYVEDYVSDYLEVAGNRILEGAWPLPPDVKVFHQGATGYPMLEEAWKLALTRVQSESDCVAVGLAAYIRARSDVAERAWITGADYSSATCAFYLGALLQTQGRPKEAEAAYREALRINLQHADAHNNLGTLLEAQGRPEEAEAAYREALLINPRFAGARHNLGNLL
jgi:hypothetical protein